MNEAKPVRIQRKRTKGFNLQAASPNGLAVVSVCRPGKWGNPHPVLAKGCEILAVKLFEQDLISRIILDKQGKPLIDSISELRGKNLACFCGLDQPCHADVLLNLLSQ
jgi:ribosomal protein L34